MNIICRCFAEPSSESSNVTSASTDEDADADEDGGGENDGDDEKDDDEDGLVGRCCVSSDDDQAGIRQIRHCAPAVS